MKPAFIKPTQAEIVEVLKSHPLIRLREPVSRAFVVGSFAKGTANEESDIDILLEVRAKVDVEAKDVEDSYRNALRNHFMKNDIRGKMDSVHPQWCGRRVDVYITYDADLESRPKVELLSKPASVPRRRRAP